MSAVSFLLPSGLFWIMEELLGFKKIFITTTCHCVNDMKLSSNDGYVNYRESASVLWISGQNGG